MSTVEQELPTDEIARRAYERWQARGCPLGDGTEDWEAAKADLTAQQRRGPLWSWWCRVRNKLTGRDM